MRADREVVFNICWYRIPPSHDEEICKGYDVRTKLTTTAKSDGFVALSLGVQDGRQDLN